MPDVATLRRALEVEDYDAARRACFALEHEVAAAALTRPRREALGRARAPRRGGGHGAGGVLARSHVEAHRGDRGGAVREHRRGVRDPFPRLRHQRRAGEPRHGGGRGRPERNPGREGGAAAGRPNRRCQRARTATFDSVSRQIEASRRAAGDADRVARRTTGERRPAAHVKVDGDWHFGFTAELPMVPYSTGRAARAAGSNLWSVVTGTGSGFAGLFSSQGRSQLSGPVGIVEISQQQLEAGWSHYLEILAFVSMSLALSEPAPAAAARRRTHSVLVHRGRSPARPRARGLRAGLGARVSPHPAGHGDRVLE